MLFFPPFIDNMLHDHYKERKSSIHENRKTISKILSGKQILKNVLSNPPGFKFYPSKLTDKNFPHMV